VWHASVAKTDRDTCRAIAFRVLAGVGDAAAGQWEEWTGSRGAYHLKRRLSADEAALTGPPVDIRQDREEMARRMAPVRHMLPPGFKE
jgi:hypothetical protein